MSKPSTRRFVWLKRKRVDRWMTAQFYIWIYFLNWKDCIYITGSKSEVQSVQFVNWIFNLKGSWLATTQVYTKEKFLGVPNRPFSTKRKQKIVKMAEDMSFNPSNNGAKYQSHEVFLMTNWEIFYMIILWKICSTPIHFLLFAHHFVS